MFEIHVAFFSFFLFFFFFFFFVVVVVFVGVFFIVFGLRTFLPSVVRQQMF